MDVTQYSNYQIKTSSLLSASRFTNVEASSCLSQSKTGYCTYMYLYCERGSARRCLVFASILCLFTYFLFTRYFILRFQVMQIRTIKEKNTLTFSDSWSDLKPFCLFVRNIYHRQNNPHHTHTHTHINTHIQTQVHTQRQRHTNTSATDSTIERERERDSEVNTHR